MSVGTSHAIIHDILCTLAWATPASTSTSPDRSAHVQASYVKRGKNITTYWKSEIDRTFQLNKDKDSIRAIINTMKDDFANNAESDSVQPDRVVFFGGGKEFFRDMEDEQDSYWLTGWKLGEMPDQKTLVTKGMTYCESFEVRQGDFNPSHDPFDEELTIGEFSYVNRHLWCKQPAPYDHRALTVWCQDKDRDQILPIDYERATAFSGVWSNYLTCISTNGEPGPRSESSTSNQSRWTHIGQKLFPDALTYKDAMLQIGTKWYNDQKKAMAKNTRFLEQVTDIQDTLGFGHGPNTAPTAFRGSLSSGANSDDDEDEEEKYSASHADSSETAARKKHHHHKRPRQHDEDAMEVEEHEHVKDDSPLVRYLSMQPKDSQHMIRLAQHLVEESKESNPLGFDNDAVAWQALAGQIVGNQMIHASHHLATSKLPLTALERYLGPLKEWDGTTDLDGLFEKDSQSVGWSAVHEHVVRLYLSSSLRVQDDLTLSSAPFTLTSKNTALFAVTDELVSEMIDSGNVLKIAAADGSSGGAWKTHGGQRIAHLQHSANISAALRVIQRHLALNKDERKLMHEASSEDPSQKELADELKKVINASHVPTTFGVKGLNERKMAEYLKGASKLPVLECQLPLSTCIKALNKLASYFYDTTPSSLTTKQIIHHCRPVLKWMANPEAVVATELTAGSAMTASRRFSAKLARHDGASISPQERAVLQSFADKSRVEIKNYVDAAGVAWQKRPGTEFALTTHHDVPIDVDDLVPLWQHYRHLQLEDDETLKETMIKLATTLYTRLMAQSTARLSGYSGAVVFQTWYGRQFDLKSHAAVEAEKTRVEADIALMKSTSSPAAISFPANGTSSLYFVMFSDLPNMLKHRLAANAHDLNVFRASSEEVLARASKLSRYDHGGVSSGPSKKGTFKAPKGWIASSSQERLSVYNITQDVNNTPLDAMNTIQFWVDKNNSWAHYSRRVASIGVALVCKKLGSEWNEQTMKENAGTLYHKISPYWSNTYKEWIDNRPTPVTFEEVTVDVPNDQSVLDTNTQDDLIDRLLSGTSLHDCRLYHFMVENDIEPFIGFLYMWPWIRMLALQIVMCKDGLGSVFYREPDCLMSENGQQKLVYFHMSMYFKAVIEKYRHITRAPFVYSKDYLGGGGHRMWNPLDERHVEWAQSPADHVEVAPDMFVIPTRIDREVKAEFMSATGRFHESVVLPPEDMESTIYELDDLIRTTWNWDIERQGLMTEDPVVRMDNHTPFDNMLLCQAHTQYYNLDKKEYSLVKYGAGHFGSNVYNGSMKAFKGEGFLDKKRVGTINQVVQ